MTLTLRRVGVFRGAVSLAMPAAGISGRPAFVAMMEATDLGEGDNLAFCGQLHPPGLRSIFIQTQVRPAAVIISQIPSKYAMQMGSV